MNRIFKKAKSLCAVLLSCAMVLTSVPKSVSADESSQDLDAENNYVYSMTIEFGSFDFYYDYGVWDSAGLKYKANDTSEHPAKGTQNTFPGWYGFDGTANRISVKNESLNAGAIHVTIAYTDVPLDGDKTDTVSFPLKTDAVKMTCYDDVDFTTLSEGATVDSNGCSFDIEGVNSSGVSTVKDIYISFSGRPVNPDGTDFVSAQAQRIGYITLTVSLPDPIIE